MAKITETTLTKEQKGRKHIAEFLAAMKYHDDDLQTTIKIMRKKLEHIQQKQFPAINKPPTIRKIIFKFGGSKTSPIVLQKRPHSETLISGAHNNAIEIHPRNTSTHSKTLICKRQKINNNNGVDKAGAFDQLRDHSTSVLIPENPNFDETTINNNNGVNVMDFIKSMGGSETELVIEKRLTSSDVTDNQGRLLIPALKVNNQGFLTKDEKIILGKKQDISVCVFDLKRRKSTLNLAKWRMSKEYYVLKTNWNHVVKTNGLKEGMVIKVLSFRVHQKLCFALNRVG